MTDKFIKLNKLIKLQNRTKKIFLRNIINKSGGVYETLPLIKDTENLPVTRVGNNLRNVLNISYDTKLLLVD